MLDAFDTLSKFMVDGFPDPVLFKKVIGGVFEEFVDSRYEVRAFGEMVALLWENGNRSGAVELEELWNNIQKEYSFSLFCAYPMNILEGESQIESFAKVCDTHSNVLPTESYLKLENSEEQLRRLALLEQKAKSLEEEVKKRKKLEKQKDDFLAVASHELKTPLTSIKAFAQILGNKFEKEGLDDNSQMLSKMNNQIDKLNNLIGDLLDVSRIDEGKLEFREDYFDFNELVEEISEEVQRTDLSHKITKHLADSVTVFGDRDRIGQVITNYLTNAIKYSPNSKSIILKTEIKDKMLTFSVQDFGIGVPENKQKKIFERFYRVEGGENSSISGLGIGLHIASEIIKRQKGQVGVKSTPSQGSTFYFSLPIS